MTSLSPNRASGVSALKGFAERTTRDGWRSGSLRYGSLVSTAVFLSPALKQRGKFFLKSIMPETGGRGKNSLLIFPRGHINFNLPFYFSTAKGAKRRSIILYSKNKMIKKTKMY